MNWALGLAIYIIIWWTMLFTILPFGIKSQQEAKQVVPGSEPGAPTLPRLGRKLLVNTAISTVLWLIADYAYIHYYLQP
jgi:predicted secreted protein